MDWDRMSGTAARPWMKKLTEIHPISPDILDAVEMDVETITRRQFVHPWDGLGQDVGNGREALDEEINGDPSDQPGYPRCCRNGRRNHNAPPVRSSVGWTGTGCRERPRGPG